MPSSAGHKNKELLQMTWADWQLHCWVHLCSMSRQGAVPCIQPPAEQVPDLQQISTFMYITPSPLAGPKLAMRGIL